MTKIYDRRKKEWITPEENERRYSKKDANICRGKKPHDFVLVLPTWIKTDERYQLTPEVYYDAMDSIDNFTTSMSDHLAVYGIIVRHYGRRSRLYVCSVCKKQHYV